MVDADSCTGDDCYSQAQSLPSSQLNLAHVLCALLPALELTVNPAVCGMKISENQLRMGLAVLIRELQNIIMGKFSASIADDLASIPVPASHVRLRE